MCEDFTVRVFVIKKGGSRLDSTILTSPLNRVPYHKKSEGRPDWLWNWRFYSGRVWWFDEADQARSSSGLILLVEQNTRQALAVADNVCVLESGIVAWSGTAEQAKQDSGIIEAYIGLSR